MAFLPELPSGLIESMKACDALPSEPIALAGFGNEKIPTMFRVSIFVCASTSTVWPATRYAASWLMRAPAPM
jgi:hypothetical protein